MKIHQNFQKLRRSVFCHSQATESSESALFFAKPPEQSGGRGIRVLRREAGMTDGKEAKELRGIYLEYIFIRI